MAAAGWRVGVSADGAEGKGRIHRLRSLAPPEPGAGVSGRALRPVGDAGVRQRTPGGGRGRAGAAPQAVVRPHPVRRTHRGGPLRSGAHPASAPLARPSRPRRRPGLAREGAPAMSQPGTTCGYALRSLRRSRRRSRVVGRC